MPASRLARCAATLFLLAIVSSVPAADWPQWRHDARRGAASPKNLPDEMQLQWVRRLPPLEPAWPDQAKMQLDAAYLPVVKDRRMFVGSSFSDTLTAYDTSTGKELWVFQASGPVRFAPSAWEDVVFFASDDGHLYCVDAAKGTLRWKFRGGPSDRLVLGNERLISTWPARGAPVVADGTVYFSAGIWPFMGIFLHALDARTGKVIWTNDGDGSVFIKQPHNADSFAGVAPQGPLVVTGDSLLIPGGRSVPACYDRKTGKLKYYLLGENGKRGGGSEVSACDRFFFNGRAAFDLTNGKYLGPTGDHVSFTDRHFHLVQGDDCHTFDLTTGESKTIEMVDRKGKTVKTTKWVMNELGETETIDATSLIRAGGRLYLGGDDEVVALDLPLKKDDKRRPAWRGEVDGTVAGLLAADDRLFAVTAEGSIYCFGSGKAEPVLHPLPSAVASKTDGAARVKELLNTTKTREGYCVAWGAGRLARDLASQGDFRVIVVEPDAKNAAGLRDALRSENVAGERISVYHADPANIQLPPYLASVMVTEAPQLSAEYVRKLFHSLRPFGGVACLSLVEEKHAAARKLIEGLELPGARVRSSGEWLLLSREGPLPGSADWTHEHADAANTRVSKDKLVKAPLGVLWFGGPSHDGILPRHGHGPQPQVIDGRILIEGIDMLRAMDCYTGRVLWEASLPGVGKFYNNTAHQPGANSSGTNFISTSDGIYVAYGQKCVRLDPATGKTMSEFRLPELGGKDAPPWGYINVAGEYLIAGADPLFSAKAEQPAKKEGDTKSDDKPKDVINSLLTKVERGNNDNLSSSKHLVLMDRHTGKVLWTATAQYWFRHNGVCVGGDRLYAIDRLSGPQLTKLKRRGEEPEKVSRLVVFDLKTGKQLWTTDDDVFGTWLSYSKERDVLVEAGRVAGDTINDEAVGMRAYRGETGKVLWHEDKHTGPAMIHNDTILMAGKACSLLTGKLKTRKDPLTGQEAEWTWSRTHGCNTPAASEHLLTFRSGAAGFYDLCNDGGTGNLGGFRSSCTNNLIVAAGVLSAPDYTRTCTCSYQNQTSLGLVHMPEAELWTYFSSKAAKGPIERAGINLGAPGDRRAEDGTLWVEFPSVGGKSPALTIATTPEKPEFLRRHSSQMQGEGMNWVTSSAAKGLKELTVDLSGGEAKSERAYTVRLYFAELEDAKPGDRKFDVTLQGETVLRGFDVVEKAGGRMRGIVREFKGVKVGKDLVVGFRPADTEAFPALLSGIEVIAEGK